MVLLVSSGFRIKHVCPYGRIAACYSEDDGKTWTAPTILFSTGLDDRDAGLAVSGNRVIVTTFTNSAEYQRKASKQSDEAWQERVAKHFSEVDAEALESKYLGALYAVSEDGGKTFGEPKRIPVSAPHGPAVAPDGKMVYVGCCFAQNVVMDKEQTYKTVRCYKENDEGDFEYISSIDNIPTGEDGPLYSCEPHSIVLPSGKIIAHIRAERFIEGKEPAGAGWEAFTLYQSVSTDGGKTFSPPVRLHNILGGAPAHLYRTKDGTLISAYAYRDYVDPSKPSAVCALISRDEGESWTPYYICAGEHSWDMGYPATVEKADGTLLTIFYDHKGDGPAIIKAVDWSLPET